MTLFLIIGVLGVVVILVAILAGDLFGGVDGATDVVGTEVIGAFLGAFGFVGAITLGVTGQLLPALVVGLASGALLGVAAGWASRRLQRPDHTGSVRTSDLLERRGSVLTDIPAGGFGVVSLSVGGHPTRVNATSTTPIPHGTDVVIVSVQSPTAVTVVPLFHADRDALPDQGPSTDQDPSTDPGPSTDLRPTNSQES